MLNIYNIEKSNEVNGNGKRYVIWVQGCDLACEGCWNQQTWSFENKILKSAEDVFQDIVESLENIDGVTFSGGEPFLQAEELSQLARMIKTETNLSIQIFTGFNKEELVNRHELELLKYTDILIAGRFNEKLSNNNQTLYLLNEDCEMWNFNNSDVEIEIDGDLNLKITGYPTNRLIKDIKVI